MNHDQALADKRRIAELESALTHHQRDFEQVNQVVIDLGRQVDQLTRRLARVEAALQRVIEQFPSTEPDIGHEKPPHY